MRAFCLRGLLAAFAAISGLAATGAAAAELIGDAERGAKVFEKCMSCHAVGADARHKVGPHLNGVFGRKAAGLGDFDYSRAMRRAGADGLVWTIEMLEAYLENPKVLVTGTNMRFRGLKDRQDRLDVMAYLRQFSDRPRDIPEAEPTRSPKKCACPTRS